MSILRYKSESDIPAHLQARMRGKVSANQDDTRSEADISRQIIGCAPEAITGRIDAPAHKQEGDLVSTRAEALYAARVLLPSAPEYVVLPYPISANRYWRNFRGRMVISKEAEEYKAKVIWAFYALAIVPTKDDVALSIKLHPKLTTKGRASRTVIDLDNCIKVCLDALQGVLYVNDKQVKKLTAEVGEPVLGGGLSVGVNVV